MLFIFLINIVFTRKKIFHNESLEHVPVTTLKKLKVSYIWAGTATHSEIWNTQLQYGVRRLCDSHIDVTVNLWNRGYIYDPVPSCVSFVNYPGAKPYFWKKVFVPERVKLYDYIWFFDDDLVVWPPTFHIENVVEILKHTGSSIGQPRLAPLSSLKKCPAECRYGLYYKIKCPKECRSSDYVNLRASEPDSSCLVETTQKVEVSTPVFTSKAWKSIHEHLLVNIHDQLLKWSDWTLPHMWCGLMLNTTNNTACIVTWHSLVHLNFATIDKYKGRGHDIRRASFIYPPNPLYLYVEISKNNTREKCWNITDFL